MPRTAQAVARLRELQRSNILQAAGRVLAQKGAAATMDDIAAEAGVSHGLAYRYFKSKEEIVRALVSQALHAPAANISRLGNMPGTPWQRLEAMLSEFVAGRNRQPEFYQLLDQALQDPAMPDEFRALIQKRANTLQSALRRLIVEGQAANEVAAGDPDQLVAAIMVCMEGLTRWAAHKAPRSHAPDAVIFLRMLKP